jgi:hypothetical protein
VMGTEVPRFATVRLARRHGDDSVR